MGEPLDPRLAGRVIIEDVTPQVDEGRYPAKRTAGEEVVVEADVFADGHDLLAAVVLWRQTRGGPPRPRPDADEKNSGNAHRRRAV